MQNEGLILKELREINSRMGSLETKIDNLETKVDNLETKVDNLPTREELYAVMDEQQQDVIAILQILQKHTERIDTKLDILNSRSFEQETDLRMLKAAK